MEEKVYSTYGYDQYGYDKEGNNRDGFNEKHIHKVTRNRI